jgi:hypothetical protein
MFVPFGVGIDQASFRIIVIDPDLCATHVEQDETAALHIAWVKIAKPDEPIPIWSSGCGA